MEKRSIKEWIVRTCILLAGLTIAHLGVTLFLLSDLVAVVLSDKLHRSFSVVRLLVDGAFALIGFALGGTVGAGTIVCVALVGPVAGIFLPVSEKTVSRILACVSLPSGK